MAHPALDELGRILMTRVRDVAIQECRAIVNGQMKSKRAMDLHQLVNQVGHGARELLLAFVPEVVDTTLHHLLWTLEQIADDEPPAIQVLVRVGDEVVPNIAEVSDGLCGDLFTWVENYSTEPGGSNLW